MREMRGVCHCPTGATRNSPMSTRTAEEIESLQYSPGPLPPLAAHRAFSSEAWPAQPQGQDQGRADGLPAALRWMHRLGDFLKTHTAMETFTTMTRQQIVQSPGLEGWWLYDAGAAGAEDYGPDVIEWNLWRGLVRSRRITLLCLGEQRPDRWKSGFRMRRCCILGLIDQLRMTMLLRGQSRGK